MDDSDRLTDLIAQIATEKAALSKLSIIKETLQNEVVAKREELEREQGVKRKQQEKHTQPKKEQKQHRIQKPIVQVCQAKCSIAQTWHPQVHQPDTMFVWMKPLLMHKKSI